MEYIIQKDDYLMHYGVLGMKWGVRRYQNADGTLTRAGKKKALKVSKELNKKLTDSFKALDDYEKISKSSICKKSI